MRNTPTIYSTLRVSLWVAALCAGCGGFGAFARENTPESSGATRAKVVRDLSYKPDAATDYEKERCKLDVYLASGDAPSEGHPALVWFHGGGIKNGEKDTEIAQLVATALAGDGMVVMSANYRLSPKVKFPAYLDDAAASVAWALEHAADYGGDPERVYVSGHSAGGYLTAMVGLDPRYLSAYGQSLDKLAGIVPVSGQMITHSTVREERGISRVTPLIDEAAPCFYARNDTPPVLLLAGGDDMPARVEENALCAAFMKAAKNERVTLLVVPGRNHREIAAQIGTPGDPAREAILKFVGLK